MIKWATICISKHFLKTHHFIVTDFYLGNLQFQAQCRAGQRWCCGHQRAPGPYPALNSQSRDSVHRITRHQSRIRQQPLKTPKYPHKLTAARHTRRWARIARGAWACRNNAPEEKWVRLMQNSIAWCPDWIPKHHRHSGSCSKWLITIIYTHRGDK